MNNKKSIDEIIQKYGGYTRTGRVSFPTRAYIMIAETLVLDWNRLSHYDKIFLKGEMIEHFAGTSTINEEYWQKKQII